MNVFIHQLMKENCMAYGLMLLIIFAFPSFALADAFKGEGKQAYIERCISTTKMPGYSIADKKMLCKCFADKLEKGYQQVLKSIKSSDSMATAQKKMDNIGVCQDSCRVFPNF